MKRRANPATLLGALVLAAPGFSWALEHKIYVPFALRETGPTSNVAYHDPFRSEISVTNVGSVSTTVHAAFYDLDGNVVRNVYRTLGPKATARLVLSAEFGASAFAGSAVLTADQPLASIVLQRPSRNYSRPAPLARAFSSPGENRVYLPTVLRHTFDSTTRFAVQNTSDEAATLTVKIYDVADQQLKYLNQWVVSPWASLHVDLGELDMPSFSGSGSAVIESTGTIVASAMELDTRNQQAKGFEGVARGSRKVYVATALCLAFENTTTYYAVQNTSSSATATVRVEYSNGVTQDVTIGPGAKSSVNPCGAGAGAGFSGAAQMTVIDGDANILVLAKAADPYNSPTAFHGAARGGRRIALPYVRWSSSESGGRTYVAIQNLADETQVATVRFYDASGRQRGSARYLSVEPLQKRNIDFGAIENTYFYGSALIEGPERANFNVIARTIGDDDTSLTPREDYNGFVVLGALGNGIDISHGTGQITLDNVRCWVEEQGVQHIVVRAAIHEETSGANRVVSRQQLEMLWYAMEEEGLNFSVDLYLYLHWPPNFGFTTPVRDQVREAIDILQELNIGFPPLPVSRLWIDLEEVPPWCPSIDNCDVAKTVSLVGEALGECGAFPCGIYTREGWWVNRTGDSPAYAAYPLWYARYVNACPLNPTFSDFETFGGWTAPLGKQFADNKPAHCSGNLCSKSVDYDIMHLR